MDEKIYQTYQIQIKKGHLLYVYCQSMCQNAKNLYNTTNFYIRQVYTAMTTTKTLHSLQKEVIETIQKGLDKINEKQLLIYQKRMAREQKKPKEQQKDVKANLFFAPTKEKPYVSYSFLDALFKHIQQKDYRSLPTQCSQAIMKGVFQNWKSFYATLKDYRDQPTKYSGKPKIPKYSRAKEKEVIFSNQDCEMKEGKYLKLPYIKTRLNIGKLGQMGGKLKQIRLIPKHALYVFELIFENDKQTILKEDNNRYMGIDLGIDNLATITSNTGMTPVLFKGKHIKSINQYYNKQKAHYMSILRHGKQPKEGRHTSRRLEGLHLNRFNKIKDLFHKVSYHIVQLAIKEDLHTIIIGKNKQWKQKTDIGKQNNQTFCSIPHSRLIQMITYKAEQAGIQVILTEESYTSKASFLDHDILPSYEEGKKFSFSGKRINRGLYKSSKGLINADVNGSLNIIRKVVPNAFAKGIEGLFVSTPLSLSVQ